MDVGAGDFTVPEVEIVWRWGSWFYRAGGRDCVVLGMGILPCRRVSGVRVRYWGIVFKEGEFYLLRNNLFWFMVALNTKITGFCDDEA